MTAGAHCRMCGEVRESAASLLEQHLNWAVKQLKIQLTPDLPSSVCSTCLQELQEWSTCIHRSKLAQPLFTEALSSTKSTFITSEPSDIKTKNSNKNITKLAGGVIVDIKELSVQLEKLSSETIDKFIIQTEKIASINKLDKTNKLMHTNCDPIMVACDYCGKLLKTKHYVLVHYKRHINICPFKCKICCKKFARKSDLNNHEICVHASCRPYQCNLCDQAFKIKGHLTAHIKRHSEKYKCTYRYCVLKFKTSRQLCRHKRQAHV